MFVLKLGIVSIIICSFARYICTTKDIEVFIFSPFGFLRGETYTQHTYPSKASYMNICAFKFIFIRSQFLSEVA